MKNFSFIFPNTRGDDALQYVKQVEETIRSRRKDSVHGNSADEKPTSGEYLSGFHKKDKLVPVITLVIYFGSEPWDSPTRLHEMLAVQDEKILSFVPDYKINLIAPAEMTEDEIQRLTTDLREVLLFVKYEEDEEKLDETVRGNERFKHLRRQAVQLINVVTGAKIPIKKREEQVDVCKGIRDMKKRARREGRSEGRSEGIEIGRKKETVSMVIRLLTQKKLSYAEIAEVSGLSIEEIEQLARERSA